MKFEIERPEVTTIRRDGIIEFHLFKETADGLEHYTNDALRAVIATPDVPAYVTACEAAREAGINPGPDWQGNA